MDDLVTATYVVAGVTGLVAIVTGLVAAFGIKQIYELKRSVQGGTYQSIVTSLIDIEKLFVSNPELTAVWGPGPAPPYFDSDRDPKQTRLDWLAIIGIDYLHLLHYLFKKKSMEPETWTTWLDFYSQAMTKNTLLRQIWEKTKYVYDAEFRQTLDQKLNSLDTS